MDNLVLMIITKERLASFVHLFIFTFGTYIDVLIFSLLYIKKSEVKSLSRKKNAVGV